MNKTLHYSIILLLFIVSLLFFYTFYNNEPLTKNIEHNTAIVTFLLDNETSITFHCELAITAQQQQQGLMNRSFLPHNQGMLFLIDPPRNVTFWMKDTLIPLDIIFIDETKKIINIESAEVEQNVSVFSLTRYYSHLPATYVVEINYGLSKFFGIKNGTEIIIEYL
jgi:uncharacterized protein